MSLLERQGSFLSFTRRQSLAGLAMTVGGFALGTPRAWAAAGGLVHTAEAIHQEPVLTATPKRIYEALLDAKQFQKIELLGGEIKASDLAAKPAEISRVAGGAFTLFAGHIVGRQIELVAEKRIVQAWREVTWAAGAYSLVKFELVAQGSGARIIFDHTGFPAGAGDHLAIGWKANYWEPLERYLS